LETARETGSADKARYVAFLRASWTGSDVLRAKGIWAGP